MLKTDYKNDELDTSTNEKRKYNMINNDDGTVSLEDVTTYTQTGDVFGAQDINATNEIVNEHDTAITDLQNKFVITSEDPGEGATVDYPDGTIIFVYEE